METPTSTRWRRARLALVGLAAAAPLLASATPSAQADPGDSGRVSKLNAQIEKLDKAYGGDLAKLKDTQFAVKQALSKSQDLKQDLTAARSLVAQMAASQYMSNGADPSVTALSSDDPTTVLSNASLVSHVAQNQAGKVKQIQQLVAAQEQARRDAEKKIDELEGEIKDLVKQKARVKALLKKYKPESPSVGMGGITARMKKVHDIVDQEMGPFPTIGCFRSTGDPQDHGTGHACDFMVTTGGTMASGAAKDLGDRTAAFAISNASKLGIKYIIWRQRIYDMRSPGWRGMENRGGVTANHYDHVHISVF